MTFAADQQRLNKKGPSLALNVKSRAATNSRRGARAMIAGA
jgi:hypothetical protein